MSERRKLLQRLRQLADIRDIMDAMKNLALAEIFKLKPRLENQQQMVVDLERMAADFLNFNPYSCTGTNAAISIWVLFGSERGFCGDFNEALAKKTSEQLQTTASQTYIILTGNKLSHRFAENLDHIRVIDGADVAEEVPAVLNRIVDSIGQLQTQFHTVNVDAIFHDTYTGQITSKQLLPPFQSLPKQSDQHRIPPFLYIPPADFFSLLVDEYLYVALHEIAYMSLLVENNKRIQHMTGALQRLDEKSRGLTRQYHFHRQEEITQEIEVILLNTANI